MATNGMVEPETTPNPQTSEEEKTETAPAQEAASPEQDIKHPLQNSKTWQENLCLISKFDTVEDFWALYNHIQLFSNLMPGCDYSLFKDRIEPLWEDEKNRRGGRWLITLTKQQRQNDLDPFCYLLGYQSHTDTATKSGSTTKNRFVV
uniref:Eukaryotic translation initiation factor 4E n=1 Tax=Chelonoidis abingdonii TaxID=106734 RepID=A0A8C0ILZ1_CHEAB